MPGRKPAISLEEIKTKIKEYELLDSSYKINSRSDEVWQKISDFFQNKVTNINIFLMVKSNRNEILCYYLQQNNILSVYLLNNPDSKLEEKFQKCKSEANYNNGDNNEQIKDYNIVSVDNDITRDDDIASNDERACKNSNDYDYCNIEIKWHLI